MAVLKFHRDMVSLSDDTIIWKYYSLSKFMWLLENQKIFMCRVDKFSDKGEIPATKFDADFFRYTLEEWDNYLKIDRERTYVSSWIMSDHEMALMWNSYASSNEGIAIKTTIGNLRRSCIPNNDVYLGAVRYINPQVEGSQIPGEIANALRFPFTKRNLFEQEKEFRMVYVDIDYFQRGIEIDQNIPCDLNKLLREIHICPDAQPHYIELIKLIIQRYGLVCDVKRSELLL